MADQQEKHPGGDEHQPVEVGQHAQPGQDRASHEGSPASVLEERPQEDEGSEADGHEHDLGPIDEDVARDEAVGQEDQRGGGEDAPGLEATAVRPEETEERRERDEADGLEGVEGPAEEPDEGGPTQGEELVEDEQALAVVEDVPEELGADDALPGQPPRPLAQPGVVDVDGAVDETGQGQARQHQQADPDQSRRQAARHYFAGVTTMLRKRTLPWSPWSMSGPGSPSQGLMAPPVMPSTVPERISVPLRTTVSCRPTRVMS